MTAPLGFWDFSVRTYRQPDVADACLALQDDYGLDVNMLLFCCWVGAWRGRCDEAVFAAAVAFSETWADRVVRPLRGVRRWMKADGCQRPGVPSESCAGLRERIKAVELESEHLQHEVLAALMAAPAAIQLADDEKLCAAADNLRAYLRHQRIDPDDRSLALLATIMAGAVVGSSQADALTALTAGRNR